MFMWQRRMPPNLTLSFLGVSVLCCSNIKPFVLTGFDTDAPPQTSVEPAVLERPKRKRVQPEQLGGNKKVKADNDNDPLGDEDPDYVEDKDDQEDNKYKDSEASKDDEALLRDLTLGSGAITQEMRAHYGKLGMVLG